MIPGEALVDGQFYGGPCDQSIPKTPILNPFNGQVVGAAADLTWDQADVALGAAARSFGTWSRTSRAERRDLLLRISASVRDRRDELSETLVAEIGKPITLARGEVDRMAITFDLAANLLLLPDSKPHALDYDPRGKEYECRVHRVPRGVVLAITPYNWPFNLAAHKIAPALAAGCSLVVKSSPLSPLSTMTLARLIHEAGAPAGVINAVNTDVPTAERMVRDPRVAVVSFTGSETVGWHIKSIVPEKQVVLEMGGDSSAIIFDDAELDWAVARTCLSAYGYAGQVCISAQHARVQSGVYEKVRARLIAQTNATPTGDPADPKTVCGPMISSAASARIEEWVAEAVDSGAIVLAGGTRDGNVLTPTLIESVPPGCRLAKEEAFGPILTLSRFDSEADVAAQVNASRFGLQAAVFTANLSCAGRLSAAVDVGGVIVNDAPSIRFDGMPYGGIKRSGFGREGVEYAYEEFTEPRVVVTRRASAETGETEKQ